DIHHLICSARSLGGLRRLASPAGGNTTRWGGQPVGGCPEWSALRHGRTALGQRGSLSRSRSTRRRGGPEAAPSGFTSERLTSRPTWVSCQPPRRRASRRSSQPWPCSRTSCPPFRQRPCP